MGYIGLKKAEERAAMIAWLRTKADSPDALPNSAEIAAEAAELAPPAPVAPATESPVAAPADDAAKKPAAAPAAH